MQEASQATADIVASNWSRVQEQVLDACAASGRDRDDVMIVGVSKYVGPELTLQLANAGCTTLGENRPQWIWEKSANFQQNNSAPKCSWHMIGHLQKNKIRRTLPLIECLHSLDSPELAVAVNSEAAKLGMHINALVEVNVTQDATKTGLSASEAELLLDRAEEFDCIKMNGFMAMSSLHAKSDDARREFATVRRFRDQMSARYPRLNFEHLSMGMSGDFREAIAEGATMVRIGSNLWEGILQP